MNKTHLNNIATNNNYTVAFKSDNKATVTVPAEKSLERTPSKDKVEISIKKKKKTHPIIKLVIGAAIGAGAILTTAFLVSRHQTNQLKKLYDEKLIKTSLPEIINFKEATTLDEAIKFSKEVLKIKDVDKNFSLEAINMINKGLVEVSNANKGKCYLPTALRYKVSKNEKSIASVVNDIHSKDFGRLNINPKYFDNAELEKIIDNILFDKQRNKYFSREINSPQYISNVQLNFQKVTADKELSSLIQKYYTDRNSMTLKEKKLLAHSLSENNRVLNRYKNSPISFLEEINTAYKTRLEKNNININFSELKNRKKKDQIQYVESVLRKIADSGDIIEQSYIIHKPETVIFHEMGHLQDFGKNLKDLDVKQTEFTLKGFWEEVKKEFKGENTDINIKPLFNNRWGGRTYPGFEELLNKNPQKFKQKYPDLYEFLTNTEIQETTGKISKYSQTSIGEFIAETYVKMINKEAIPEDVMKLYIKYNGPLLPK